jgi:hypothetical protein
VLAHEPPPVDVWIIRDDARDILLDHFGTVTEEQAVEASPFLVRICRLLCVPHRVIEAAWNAARRSESWRKSNHSHN